MLKGIKQHDLRDCGAACLATASRYYGLKLPLIQARELARVDKNGVSLYGLRMAAEQLGFAAEALKGDWQELQDSIMSREIQFPLIAHVLIDHTLDHYIVIKKIKRHIIYIFDPANGHKRLSRNEFLSMWDGYILNLKPGTGFKKRNQKKGFYTKYLSIFFRVKKTFLTVIMVSIFTAAISVAGAFLYQIIIDDYILGSVTPGQSDSLSALFKMAALNIDKLFIVVLSLYFFQAILHFIRGFLISLAARKIDSSLLELFYNHIFRLPIRCFQDRDTGEIMSRFQDISSIRNIISEAGLSLAVDSAMLVVGIIILIRISTVLFAVSTLIIFIYMVVVFTYRKPITRLNHEVMESYSKLNAASTEAVSGIETIKSCRGERKIKDKLHREFSVFLNNCFKENITHASLSGLLLANETIGALLILWIGSRLVRNGQLSLGALISFETLMQFFISPLKSLINLQPAIQKAVVAADRLNDILEVQPEDRKPRFRETEIRDKKIRFQNVSFGYGYREEIIDHVSFSIDEKENIAFIGKSGNGKSTLARLLAGFYEPADGDIYIGDVSIREILLEKIRKEIVYVPQETIIFSGTIEENLLFGVEHKIDNHFMDTVIQACRLQEVLEKVPFGIYGRISENGRNLSGGQRQIIALARALLMKPGILILDESTNQLDAETERSVLKNIFELCRDIICIHITHNLELSYFADRIIELKDNKMTAIEKNMSGGKRF